MKKTDLIHLIIVVIALFLIYSALNLLPNLFTYLLFWITGGLKGDRYLDGLIPVFISFALYIILASMVLKNSARLSNYVATKYDVHNPPVVNSSRHDLLYILFIGLGVYTLLQKLPLLLQNIYHTLSDHNTKSGLLDDGGYYRSSALASQIISVLIAVFLIFYAKFLADNFSDKLPSEQEHENTETDHQIL